jgi:hypothetical protein
MGEETENRAQPEGEKMSDFETSFLISAKAVHLKTYMPRTAEEKRRPGSLGFVKLETPDGTKFNAKIRDLDPLFKIGRGTEALFEFDDNPLNPEYPDVPGITNIYKA